MSVLTCRGCTARYSVGAPACPQCGSTDRVEGDAVADPDLASPLDAPAAELPPAAADATTPAKAKAAAKPAN